MRLLEGLGEDIETGRKRCSSSDGDCVVMPETGRYPKIKCASHSSCGVD